MDARAPQAGGIFLGWRLVGALGVILFFTGGGGLYVFPVFIESFQAEFGWSITQISSGAAVFAIAMGISGPLVGVLFARFGARPVMLTGALVMTGTSIGYASLQSLTMLYLLMLCSGFGVAATTILPAQTLVTNWFDAYRGRALGLAMLGIGFGGFLLPPFNEFLIRVLSWRQAWFVAAAVNAGVVIPLIAVFIRTRPGDLGLRPDGARSAQAGATAASAPVRGLSLRRAVRTEAFWLLVGVFIAQLIGLSAMNFHFVPFAIKQGGFTSQEAAFYYGLTVGFSIVGRLLFGWLTDRFSPKWLMVVAGVSLALGPAMAELLVVRLALEKAWLLVFYAIPFGIGIGGNAITMPVLVGRCFGELNFSKIMGVVMSGFALGIIIGIPLAGRIFDETGSYELVLLLCVGTLLLSAIFAASIRPDRYRAEFEPEAAARHGD
ncbi:MAG: MFS transporter [Myxococcota bacterium]